MQLFGSASDNIIFTELESGIAYSGIAYMYTMVAVQVCARQVLAVLFLSLLATASHIAPP